MHLTRKMISICVIVLYCSLCINTVAANPAEETVNDLFRLYNEAELIELREAEAEYQKAMETYLNLRDDAEMVEFYNTVIEDSNKFKEVKKEELTSEIDSILQQNSEIKNLIEENIYGDWNTLIRYKNQIDINNEKINILLSERSKYTVAPHKDFNYENLDDVEREVEQKLLTYQEATDVATLGEVTNVKYPLNADTKINSKYGERVNPLTGSGITYHTGLDLYAVTGTEVLSLFNGVVSSTGYSPVCGYYINVDHGNSVVSFYCHLSKIMCSEGQTVSQYDVIASSGNTGSATTGAHLHLGLYINGNSVNPGILFKED